MSKTESYCAKCKRGMLARRVTQNKISFKRGRRQGAEEVVKNIIYSVSLSGNQKKAIRKVLRELEGEKR